MKIDLHVHCSERSQCARNTEAEQIQAALAAGLDGIAFTDHHRLPHKQRLAELNQAYAPFKIFTGIEITAGNEDWLVLGVHDPVLENQLWEYADLRAYAHQLGAMVILAHPFRYRPEIKADLTRFPPDGIELRSRNTPAQYESQIRSLAIAHNLVLLTNSDAHFKNDVGAYYNTFDAPIANDASLIQAILELRPNGQAINK